MPQFWLSEHDLVMIVGFCLCTFALILSPIPTKGSLLFIMKIKTPKPFPEWFVLLCASGQWHGGLRPGPEFAYCHGCGFLVRSCR